jgi:hypothetical protein
MKAITLAVGLCLSLVAYPAASGPASVYAIVEKVVFEPNESSPERIQLWGAFSFVVQERALQLGAPSPAETVTNPQRGYMYFSLPPDKPEQAAVVRAEWVDLKAVAGTGQAVAFGQWMSMGGAVYGGVPSGRFMNSIPVARLVPLVVLTATPPHAEPAPYAINTGLVKLAADGSHAELVQKLRAALAQGATR